MRASNADQITTSTQFRRSYGQPIYSYHDFSSSTEGTRTVADFLPIETQALEPVPTSSTALPSQLTTTAVDAKGRQKIKLYTFDELKRKNSLSPTDYVVDEMLAERTVNILAGDSGLGKTAFLYQLGLCVAAGIPFLGMKTKADKVVYVDLENGDKAMETFAETISKFLKLPNVPRNFRFCQDTAKLAELDGASLVIVDSLRAYNSDAEKHEKSGAFMTDMRAQARACGATVLFIHHLRKTDRNPAFVPCLEETSAMNWLQEMSGARALVNQTDTRMGIDKGSKTDLVLRWFWKAKGEFGPLHVKRVFDNFSEPIGYELVSSIDILTPRQRDFLGKLPERFTFREAMQIYGGRSDGPAARELSVLTANKLIEKLGRGEYRNKRSPSPSGPAGSRLPECTESIHLSAIQSTLYYLNDRESKSCNRESA
jgi:hypothetical protein